MKSIKVFLYLVILTSFLAGSAVFAQKASFSEQGWIDRSFDIALTNRGLGAGATWDFAWNRRWRTPLQANILFYREANKIPYYDYYTGRYIDPPSKKIVFASFRSGIKRRLWTESLAETMRPFLLATAGPTFAIDPANTGGFIKRWSKTTFSATAHAFIGAGVEFLYSRVSQFSVTVGYEVMYFPYTVDGAHNYSGVSILLSFGERL